MGVVRALDDDSASAAKAEQGLLDIESAVKTSRCSVGFGMARAFQLGVSYQLELNERAKRKALEAMVRAKGE